MRKQYYQMLLDVIKSVETGTNPVQKLVHVSGHIMEVTDSKRVLRITFYDYPGHDEGLYQIAKAGKDWFLSKTNEMGKFPDISRILSNSPEREIIIPCTYTDKKLETVRVEPEYTAGRVLAIFGNLQTRLEPLDVRGLNYTFLSEVCKRMTEICDSITLQYIGSSYPVFLSGFCGLDKIEYAIMRLEVEE
jgi:hypothetical protein